MIETYIIEDDIYRTCEGCSRQFSLLDEIDREEYYYGHECVNSYQGGKVNVL